MTTAPATTGLLERAAALVPLLRERALDTERARRLPPEHFDALSEAGILRMMVSKRYGGEEADFQTQTDVLAELARGCPSTSWVATIFSALAWLVGVFPDETQEEILGGGDPRVSGVLAPTGTGVRKKGGVLVNGSWSFNTGCQGSDWTLVNALVDEGGTIVPSCVLVPSSDLEILDDWHALGMTGTGSNTVVAEDVFVPEHRIVPQQALLDAGYPARHNSGNPYFNLPAVPVLVVNAAGTPLGIARGALEAFLERMPGRPITFTDYKNQADAAVTHLTVGEAALETDSIASHVRLGCEILDNHPAGPLSIEARVRARAHVSHATRLARKVVDMLFHASGGGSVQPHVPIQRFQRDIQTLANHGLLLPTTTTELHGRVLCGLQPNTPLI